jgi:purine-nucleoside phosphorylase
MGMKVCGISLVSNLAAGISPRPLSSAEVEEAGKAAGSAMSKLIIDSVKKMS